MKFQQCGTANGVLEMSLVWLASVELIFQLKHLIDRLNSFWSYFCLFLFFKCVYKNENTFLFLKRLQPQPYRNTWAFAWASSNSQAHVLYQADVQTMSAFKQLPLYSKLLNT